MKKSMKNNIIVAGVLTLAVFIIHYISDITGIEALAMNGWWGWVILFLFYALGLYFVVVLISKLKLMKSN